MGRLIVILLAFVILLPCIPSSARAKTFDEAIENSAEGFYDLAQKVLELKKRVEEDIMYMEQVIFWENWSTDPEHRAAYLTGAVVGNRQDRPEAWLHSSGDGSVKDVLYAKGQYSTTKYFFTKEIPEECHEMAKDIVLHGTPDVPKDVIFQATFSQGKLYEKINGEYFCYG